MIQSRYFPDAATCFRRVGDAQIEIPKDIYDAAIDDGTIPYAARNFFVRGAYDYDTAKIFAQSGNIDALVFDASSGVIKTSSTVGISAEITFALALWNGYGRKAALERAILSRLKDFGAAALPKILADEISRVKITDGSTLEKDFAKTAANKIISYFDDQAQAAKAAAGEVSVNLSTGSKLLRKADGFFDKFGDELVILISYGETFSDLARGRISKKQAAKNAAVIFLAGAAATAAVTIAPVGGAVATFFIGFGGKLAFREKIRKILDDIIKSDRKEMLEIFEWELLKLLDGKFLTEYERELLAEAINDALDNNALKNMYACGNDSARAKWAHDFIAWRLEEIFGQRIFVEMPSAQEWQAALQRVVTALQNGEDIVANMEHHRAEALQKRRESLENYKLKPYEMAPVVRAVNAMNKTQLATERILTQMQADNRRFEQIRRQQLDERAALKDRLRRF